MKSQTSKHLRLPPHLRDGDTIAVVRPAGRLDRTAFKASQEAIRSAGFFVAEYPGKMRKDSFFAASDADRAAELSWALSEPGIQAVLCARGGYGTMRLLPHFEPREMKRWIPKLVVGYSDITFLHQWLFNQLGWISVHGPLLGHLGASEIRRFLSSLTDPLRGGDSLELGKLQVHRAGKAAGRLFGGNLSLLQTSGPAMLPREPLILLLEDVNEDFYRLDRMIWSLKLAGYSLFIKGILLGHFHKCGKNDRAQFGKKKWLESLLSLSSGPVVESARFGHGLGRQALLPLGVKVELSSKALKLTQDWVSFRR